MIGNCVRCHEDMTYDIRLSIADGRRLPPPPLRLIASTATPVSRGLHLLNPALFRASRLQVVPPVPTRELLFTGWSASSCFAGTVLAMMLYNNIAGAEARGGQHHAQASSIITETTVDPASGENFPRQFDGYIRPRTTRSAICPSGLEASAGGR